MLDSSQNFSGKEGSNDAQPQLSSKSKAMKKQEITLIDRVINNITKNTNLTTLDLSKHKLSESGLEKIDTALDSKLDILNIRYNTEQENFSGVMNRINDKLVRNLKGYCYYPSEFIFALLSEHSYSQSQEEDRVEFKFDESKEKGGFTNEQIKHFNEKLKGWTVEKALLSEDTGYYGAIYRKDNLLVLAHRGIRFADVKFKDIFKQLLNKDASNLKGLIKGALIGESVAQQWTAYEFTKTAVELAKQKGCHLSITGHSLGAFFAELSGYFCHREFEYPQVKVMSFDSPGTLEIMKQYKSNIIGHKTKFDVRNIDITTYLLTEPTLINSWNKHVGKVYVMEVPKELLKTKSQEVKNTSLNQQTIIVEQITPIEKETKFKLLTGKFKNKIKKTGLEAKQKAEEVAGELVDKICNEVLSELKPIKKAIEDIFGNSLRGMLLGFEKLGDKEEVKVPLGNGAREVIIKLNEMVDWPKVNYSKKEGVSGQLVDLAINQIPFNNILPDVVSKAVGSIGSRMINNFIQDFPMTGLVDLIADVIMGNIDLTQYKNFFSYYNNPESTALLKYESHYNVKAVDKSRDIVVSKSHSNVDYYIVRLHKYADQLQNLNYRGLTLDRNTVAVLKRIADLYTLENDLQTNNKIIISKIKELDAEVIKNVLRIIKEKYEDVAEVLGSGIVQQAGLNHLKIEANFPYERGRELQVHIERLKEIKEGFDIGKIIVLEGMEGLGKSVLAMQYGQQAYKNGNVRWFKADSKAALEWEYQSFAQSLGISVGRKIQETIALLQNMLSDRGDMLFIFDDVESLEVIMPYIEKLGANVKVLITSRKEGLLENTASTGVVKVKPFDKKEAKQFLESKLNTAGEEIDELLEITGANQNRDYLPSNLSKIVSYLEQRSLTTIKRYIKDYKKLSGISRLPISTETEIILDELTQASGKAWRILQYMSYLNASYIPVPLVEDLMNLNNIQDYVNILSKLSLITISPDKKGLQMDMFLQKNIQLYMYHKPETSLKVDKLLENILSVLDDLYPEIKDVEDKSWDKARIYSKHAMALVDQIESSHIELSKIAKLSIGSLYAKLGRYYELIMIDYARSSSYYEKALIINEDYHRLYTGAINDSARSKQNAGRTPEAGRLYDKVLAIRQLDLDEEELTIIKKNPADKKILVSSKESLIDPLGDLTKAESKVDSPRKARRASTPGKGVIEKVKDSKDGLTISLSDVAKKKQDIMSPRAASRPSTSGSENIRANKLNERPENKFITKLNTIDNQQDKERYYKKVEGVANSYHNIGRSYIVMEDREAHKKGIKGFKSALNLRIALYKDKAPSAQNLIGGIKFKKDVTSPQDMTVHPGIAWSLNNLGYAYMIKKYHSLPRIKRGVSYLELVYKMRHDYLYKNQDHPDLARSLNNLGDAYKKVGKFNKSQEWLEQVNYERILYYYQESLDMKLKVYKEAHPEIARSHHNIGTLELAKANIDNKNSDTNHSSYFIALENLEKGLQIRSKLYGDNHTDVAISLKAVGKAYKAIGDMGKCKEYYIQAYFIYNKQWGTKTNEAAKNKIIASMKKHLDPYFHKASTLIPEISASRSVIINRGVILEGEFMRKSELQEGVLNGLTNLVCMSESKDSKNVLDKIDHYIRENKLSERIDLLLCFEAINIGIMSSSSSQNFYDLSKSFLDKYVVGKSEGINIRSEYFVDGSIVKSCIGNLPQKAEYMANHIKYVELSSTNTSTNISK